VQGNVRQVSEQEVNEETKHYFTQRTQGFELAGEYDRISPKPFWRLQQPNDQSKIAVAFGKEIALDFRLAAPVSESYRNAKISKHKSYKGRSHVDPAQTET